MKPIKVLAAAAAVLTTLATAVAPPAQAFLHPGNFDLLTNRYERASWVWFIAACSPEKPHRTARFISAMPRLKFYNYYNGNAYLANGQWTLKVDVSDGLQLPPRGHLADPRDLRLGRRHPGGHHHLGLRRRLLQRPTRNTVLDLRPAAALTTSSARGPTRE